MVRLLTIIFLLVVSGMIYFFPNMEAAAPRKKVIYVDKKKRIFVNGKGPVYLRISTSRDRDAETVPLYNLNSEVESMVLGKSGPHIIGHQHKKIRKVNRRNNFRIYSDSIPPKNSWFISKSPSHRNKNGLFFGKPVRLILKAKDSLSGVKKIYYSINGTPHTAYETKIILKEENYYKVNFFSLDNVENKSSGTSILFNLDLTPPKSSLSMSGLRDGDILSRDVSFSFKSKDEMSGVSKIVYSLVSKTGDYRKVARYKGKRVTLNKVPGGDYSLSYFSVDNVLNREESQSYDFHLDKRAPRTTTNIIGDQYHGENTIYISGRSKVNIEALDSKVKVKKILWKLKNSSFKMFTGPFNLPPNLGAHELSYKALDTLNNWGRLKKMNLNLDLLPPTMIYRIIGKRISIFEKVFISPRGKVVFEASDFGSGVKEVLYSVNKGPEKKYVAPFSIKEEGVYNFSYFARDKVENEMIPNKSTIVVDATPPKIFYHFSNTGIGKKNIDGKEVTVLIPGSRLYLGSSDSLSGTKSIFYKLYGKAKRYNLPLQFWDVGKYDLEIVSYDHVGNVSRKYISFIIAKYN